MERLCTKLRLQQQDSTEPLKVWFSVTKSPSKTQRCIIFLGYSVLNKHNRFQEVEIEEGTRLRDYVVEVISDSNGEFDSSELKATLLDYGRINPGINPYAILPEDTIVKMPPHGKVASTVFNVGASQDFLRSNLSIVRGQAYSSFIASAVSKELINDVIQRFGAQGVLPYSKRIGSI